jgi:hypothetical protein
MIFVFFFFRGEYIDKPIDDDASELTMYRRFAVILDFVFDGLDIVMTEYVFIVLYCTCHNLLSNYFYFILFVAVKWCQRQQNWQWSSVITKMLGILADESICY